MKPKLGTGTLVKSQRRGRNRKTGEIDSAGRSLSAQAAAVITLDRRRIERELSREVPNDLQTVMGESNLNVKGRGNHFIGRKVEVNKVVNRTTRTVTSKDPNDNMTGTIVTGASGVGKSTLVKEIGRRLRDERNVESIEINTACFKSPVTFSDTMRSKTEHRLRRVLEQVPDIAARLGAHTLDAAATVTLWVKAAAAGVVGVAPEVQVHAAANAYNGWKERQTVSVTDCLQTLGFLFPNGVAIIVDEAQTLEDYLDHENPRESTAAQIVQGLATPDGRDAADVENATVIFAGLGDAVDVIGALGSYGLEHIQLEPMGEERVAELIMTSVKELGKEMSDQESKAFESTWLPALVMEYGEWTRHAAGAAQAAKTVLEVNSGSGITDPKSWAATVRLADGVREGVYEYVRGQARKHGVPIEVSDTLAIALAANGNALTEQQTHEIIATVQEDIQNRMQGKATADLGTLSSGSVIKGCKRAGLLEAATGQTRGVPKDMMFCPVPSLIRDIVQDHSTKNKQIGKWLKECQLKTEPAKKYTKRDTGRVRDGPKNKG